jgi:DNA-binding NarL/FixJ family response regulator
MEQRIVELVSAGRKTREVAAELHVSAKTVEWNLTRIYRKLGIRSRTELAARVNE